MMLHITRSESMSDGKCAYNQMNMHFTLVRIYQSEMYKVFTVNKLYYMSLHRPRKDGRHYSVLVSMTAKIFILPILRVGFPH